MSQNIQYSNEQNVDRVQYKCTTVETILQMNLRGTQEGIYMKVKGYYLKQVRSDGSRESRTGGWVAWAVAKSNSGVVNRLESTQIRWFSWWQDREAGPGDRWPKTLDEKLISSFRHQGDLLKQAEWQLSRKDQLTLINWLFLRGCWRMWDVADEDD
jgi:hypothetical protein